MNNKNIFAKNLKYYRELHKKTRKDVCNALGISYYTYSDWENGKKYPRMDKVEMLANYFGIQKSDLIEEKLTEEKKKDNDLLADVIVRMRMNTKFRDLVFSLYHFDDEKIEGISQMLNAFEK